MEASMAEWEKDAEGNIIVCPLVDCRATTAFGMGILLQMEFRELQGESGISTKCLQLTMTPAQAAQVGKALCEMAASIVRKSSAEKPEKPS
jgi:hypothetical protein